MTTEHAVSDIFRKYYTELCRYVQDKFARAGEADDIVQDAFQNILHVGRIESIENPRAYLYRAAKHIALNRIRREDHSSSIFVDVEDADSVGIPMDRQIIAEHDMRRVNRVLEKLSTKDRTAFLLNRVEGKSYKEISQELGVTVSTVEKRMMKALAALKEAIDEH